MGIEFKFILVAKRVIEIFVLLCSTPLMPGIGSRVILTVLIASLATETAIVVCTVSTDD
jgi:hypothetical protein